MSLQSQVLRSLRQEDHLNPGVQSQPALVAYRDQTFLKRKKKVNKDVFLNFSLVYVVIGVLCAYLSV